jgi:uncharacterized membrane protein
MLVSGWVLRKRRLLYFLILQGGGIGILYLTVFAAYKLANLPVEAALVLMSVLIPAALIIALFQNSQALAFFGFAGGFAAPVLLPAGGGIVALFVYYTILSLGILAISFFRPWKLTALLGFAANFGVTLIWFAGNYTADDFTVTALFLWSFIVLYTLLGIILLGKAAETGSGKQGGKIEFVLILGTAFLGFLGLWQIFSAVKHGYSLASLTFAGFYLIVALALLGIRKKNGQLWKIPPILIEIYGALALVLANLIIPLELSGPITLAIWAAEGALIYYTGIRSAHTRLLVAGLIVHAAAALDFIVERPGGIYGPLRSPAFTGMLLIAASACAILVLTAQSEKTAKRKIPAFFTQNRYRRLLALWVLLWWFGGWGMELGRIFGPLNWDSFAPWSFIATSGSALLFFGLSKLFAIAVLNLAVLPSLVIAGAAMLGPLALRAGQNFFYDPTVIFTYNYFNGLWLWAWLGFTAAHAAMLLLSKNHIGPRARAPWTAAYALILLPALTASLRYLTSSLNLAPSWTALAGIAPLLLFLFALSFLLKWISGMEKSFRFFTGTLLPWGLCTAAILWFTVTLFMHGNPAPLPLYIPLLNPLELQEALCAAVVIIFQIKSRRAGLPALSPRGIFIIADTLGFLWITAMLARSVYFFGNIRYDVLSSDPFNLGLFMLLALWGIGHIILGHRRALRPLWIAGVTITVLDIAKLLLFDMANTGTLIRISSFFIAGLLLLFIGYVAPVPPVLR